MPGIIDLPNFNDKDFEEIFGGGQGLFGVTYICTALTPFPYKFLVRMMINKKIEKEEDTIKRPQKKKKFNFFCYNKSLCEKI